MTKFRMFLSSVFLLMLASCSGLNNDLIFDIKEKAVKLIIQKKNWLQL